MTECKYNAVSAFEYLLKNGYITKVGPDLYSLGEEPDLLEEETLLVNFWYFLKKKIETENVQFFGGPKK